MSLGGNQEGVQVCVAPELGNHSPRTWNASALLQNSTASDIWSLNKIMAAFLKVKPASKHSEETTQRRHAWSSP